MKEQKILCFPLFFFSLTVCSAVSIDERLHDMESVIQSLLAENKALKTRLASLEELQDRVLALEQNCGTSDKSAEDDNTQAFTAERYDEFVSSDDAEAEKANNTEEYANLDRDVELKMSPKNGIVSYDEASETGHLSKRSVGSNVAFHVYLSGDRCYSSHEIFKFDTEAVDVGGGYNINDGIFDAPVTGLYLFSWTVAAAQGTWFMAELMINGAVRGIIQTDQDVGGPDSGVHMATGVVLANVNAGNHVFIRFFKGANCAVKSNAYVRTTFTGCLL